jgi:hypothetical protein
VNPDNTVYSIKVRKPCYIEVDGVKATFAVNCADEVLKVVHKELSDHNVRVINKKMGFFFPQRGNVGQKNIEPALTARL